MAGDEPLRTSVAGDAGSLIEALRAAASTPGEPAELPPGTVIGEHFVIEAPIGKGGMGAVYRARDRRLDRAVALKLNLHGTDLARAHREALALARLAHPNVVTIFEIGEHAGAPFVAMELCDGGNARTWARARPRPWREVLAVYLEAGKGLAAAHAAGLVHRDVKPDNILISGDGRAQIGDFGLARDAAGLSSPGFTARDISLDATAVSSTTTTGGNSQDNLGASGRIHELPAGSGTVTATGALIGTPRYMAPEQFEGGSIDARADQFAFSVALYEALTGVDPFPPHAAERALAIHSGRLAPPARGRAVPRRVHAVVARGLRASPDERWPSMDALLAALARAARSRAWIAVAAVGVLAIGATLAFALTRDGEEVSRGVAAPRDPCLGVPLDLAASWNPATRADFVRRHPTMAPTASWVADVVDRETADWAAARQNGCRELPRHPSWSPQMAVSMLRCLGTTQKMINDLAAVTRTKPGALVADVNALYDPRSCVDPIKLAATPRYADEETAAKVDALRRLAAQAEHAADRGELPEATRLAREGEQRAQAIGDPIGIAIARRATGKVALRQSGVAAAEGPMRDAYFGFRSSGDGVETAEIALTLTEAHLAANRLDDAASWLAHARAEAVRVNMNALNVVNLEVLAARLAEARGDFPAALAALDRADALLAKIDHPRVRLRRATVLNSRSVVLANAGRLAESLAAAEASLKIEEQIYGPDDPSLLYAIGNVGLGQLDTGRVDEAIATLARAHAMADAAFGERSVDRANAMWNHALALGRKDPATARPIFDQAVKILEQELGPDHPDTIEIRADRAKLGKR